MIDLPKTRRHQGMTMLSQNAIENLRLCNECAAACLQCASACLKETDVQSMTRCVALDMECADLCQLAAASMARGDEHRLVVCSACAMACESCATECGRHPMDHCRQCAEACKRCAAAMRSLTH
jgi:hypothetical protein